MTEHNATVSQAPGPVSYDAGTAGAIIGRTANWMKVQARAGKIPYTQIGRYMRWTPLQLAEILRAGERRPQPVLAPRAPARRRPADAGEAPLQPKAPRRKRDAA